ncbi:uncharacterized protein CLUP02_08688 [Colletotrichum lupini]|uniref:Uncharacterized protein n=1 Tax=Colletotrichum lupini TaxID=145971 RepID=A0A9Q8STC4_9PEZI|nr:uncharacterized protein CLUP02_08688 [Colletotrichum lupini]UQC83194.1 hypothetical protein CLUP02_08688 [Colletotrichum lupini]
MFRAGKHQSEVKLVLRDSGLDTAQSPHDLTTYSAVTLVAMVEMQGSAEVLNNEAEKSRVRLDDIYVSLRSIVSLILIKRGVQTNQHPPHGLPDILIEFLHRPSASPALELDGGAIGKDPLQMSD